MKSKDNSKYKTVILSAAAGLVVAAVFILIFAAVMYFAELDEIYSVIFATVSVACGCFTAAYIAAKSNKSKGFLIGAVTGGIVFVAVLLISLAADKGAIGINTLFHFIIFMLSGIVGGIIGVNKSQSTKYIK